MSEREMQEPNWHRIGPVEQFDDQGLQQLKIGKLTIALSFRDGTFGAISGVCNHVGGPLGEGTLSDDGYVTCPWHHWQFQRLTGEARGHGKQHRPREDRSGLERRHQCAQ
ncbi:MAG: Rieske 2Fe-2S domain-containing protein [Planctomycetia bacterium]|nr:Rieske 2Fe-2S domain-containing protein [Planctomycetia bacterium]